MQAFFSFCLKGKGKLNIENIFVMYRQSHVFLIYFDLQE